MSRLGRPTSPRLREPRPGALRLLALREVDEHTSRIYAGRKLPARRGWGLWDESLRRWWRGDGWSTAAKAMVWRHRSLAEAYAATFRDRTPELRELQVGPSVP